MQGAQIGLSTADRALAAGQLAQQGANTGLAGTAQSMQGAGMGLQGVGQQLAASQLGLAGGAQNIQGLQAAMQGSGYGLQGANQAINAGQYGLQGADRALAGTAQGMQGAQSGLQGVSGQQAGYGLANQSANTLGTLGNQQLAAQTGILGLQNQFGGQQQALEQQYINQAIQNYGQAQESPMQSFNQFNALLRGYALPGTTQTQYQAAPNLLSQVGGAGIAGVAMYNAMNPTRQ
jgi:hypothetical protein